MNEVTERVLNGYITENIPIEESACEDAITVGEYINDDLQTIKIQYSDSSYEQTLYNAKPSCKHKIQVQWSGIKCKLCGGWYCA